MGQQRLTAGKLPAHFQVGLLAEKRGQPPRKGRVVIDE